jgi:hypothetical protein
VKVGYHLRGGHVEQAHATRPLGQAELPRFVEEERLPQADFDGLTPSLAQVERGLRDKTVAASEAHAHTAAQYLGAREVKVARRRLDRAVARAFRHSPVRTEYQEHTHHGHSVPRLVADLRRKLALAEAHADALTKKGAPRRFLDDTEAAVDAGQPASPTRRTACVGDSVAGREVTSSTWSTLFSPSSSAPGCTPFSLQEGARSSRRSPTT